MSNSNSNIKKNMLKKFTNFFSIKFNDFFIMIFTKELNENSNGKIYFIF